MTPPTLRVIKLGGSLLDFKELKGAFKEWLAEQSTALNLVVAGGGEIVESVRTLDQTHHFDPSFTHWVAIDLMNTTARIAAHILNAPLLITDPGSLSLTVLETKRNACKGVCADGMAVVAPHAFYSPDLVQLDDHPLPESWECTSDTIAAYLAVLTQADELVLLKSSLPVGFAKGPLAHEQIEQISEAGIVDCTFPAIAKRIASVRAVNLRLNPRCDRST
jgi:5-(aminomethyl)-3-furanmethanol phosphate kinase